MLLPDRLSVMVSVSVMRRRSDIALARASDSALMTPPRELLTDLDLVDERLELGPWTLALLRPRQAEALLDEEAFDHEEFLPYWAELWRSGTALAEEIAGRDVRGLRVV